MYELTTWGQRYLDDDLDASHHWPFGRWRARYKNGKAMPRV